MTIEQTNKIDFISTLGNGSGVELTISDHLEWDEKNEKFLMIQEKLNTYLEFIESGQIYEEYPNAKGNNISISLISKYFPDPNANEFLSKISVAISKYNVEFKYSTSNEN